MVEEEKRNREKEEKLVKARGRTWGHTLTGWKIVMGREETQAGWEQNMYKNSSV